jgi:hypothetical protein
MDSTCPQHSQRQRQSGVEEVMERLMANLKAAKAWILMKMVRFVKLFCFFLLPYELR